SPIGGAAGLGRPVYHRQCDRNSANLAETLDRPDRPAVDRTTARCRAVGVVAHQESRTHARGPNVGPSYGLAAGVAVYRDGGRPPARDRRPAARPTVRELLDPNDMTVFRGAMWHYVT